MKSRSKIKEFAHATEAAELRAAFVACEWVLSHTARRLGIRYSSLQRILDRHPELQEELGRLGRRQGRPPKAST